MPGVGSNSQCSAVHEGEGSGPDLLAQCSEGDVHQSRGPVGQVIAPEVLKRRACFVMHSQPFNGSQRLGLNGSVKFSAVTLEGVVAEWV